jgi:hypothetical protein
MPGIVQASALAHVRGHTNGEESAGKEPDHLDLPEHQQDQQDNRCQCYTPFFFIIMFQANEPDIFSL